MTSDNSIHSLEKRLKQDKRHLLKKFITQAGLKVAEASYRLFEIVLALLLIIMFTLPLSIVLLLRKFMTGKPVISHHTRGIVGRGGKELQLRTFNTSRPTTANLSLLFYVLSGKLGLVGTSMDTFTDHHFAPESNYLYTGKPGIISLWNVRKNSNIGHEGNVAAEWEYRFTRTPFSDLLLILRAIPAYFFKSSDKPAGEQINLFDIHFVNKTMKNAVDLIHGIIVEGKQTESIFFVNPDCLNKTFADSSYRTILQNADYVFPDGIGLTIACKILRNPLRENVNGTDMLPFLCAMAAENGHPLFLLGGKPGVAEKMALNLHGKYQVEIAGTQHGFFDRATENDSVIQAINASGAEIVLVAFGAPLQEKWISENGSKLRASVAMGVGGLFDFYSENTRRAPRWLREIGLEWVYRIMQQPGRMWKRYVVGNPLFLLRVLVWKVRLSKHA